MNQRLMTRRRLVAWFSIAVALLLPLGAQLHALSHALRAVQEAAHPEPLAPQTQACEQCLLYGALDAALPSPVAPAIVVPTTTPGPLLRRALPRVAPFTAYSARAPPSVG